MGFDDICNYCVENHGKANNSLWMYVNARSKDLFEAVPTSAIVDIDQLAREQEMVEELE